MGMDAQELQELSAEALALIEQVKEVRADGKVTRPESRQLLRSVIALAAQLSIDVLD